jgi:hypothetical protein
VVVCGNDVRRGKPDPEPYLLAARRLGVDPARCLVLEDSVAGIAAAEAAGCFVVAVPTLRAVEPRPGRLVVPSLRDISLSWLRAAWDRWDRPGSLGGLSGPAAVPRWDQGTTPASASAVEVGRCRHTTRSPGCRSAPG